MAATAVGRDYNYRDPVALEVEHKVDFEDPLERAAIAMHRSTFEVCADVAGALTSEHGRQGLRFTWLRLEAVDRQRWRRRADLVVQAHAGTL